MAKFKIVRSKKLLPPTMRFLIQLNMSFVVIFLIVARKLDSDNLLEAFRLWLIVPAVLIVSGVFVLIFSTVFKK